MNFPSGEFLPKMVHSFFILTGSLSRSNRALRNDTGGLSSGYTALRTVVFLTPTSLISLNRSYRAFDIDTGGVAGLVVHSITNTAVFSTPPSLISLYDISFEFDMQRLSLWP